MDLRALNVGWFTAPAGIWRKGDDVGESVRFPVPAYVIDTGSERILVDTGLHPDAVADREGRYGSADALGPVVPELEQSVADQVDLGSLTRVVMTHLHYDHAGGIDLLPRDVPIVVQRAEWEGAHDDATIERNFFQPADYAAAEGRVELVDGDHDLLGDGSIRLLLTPGHTPGHQSVMLADSLVIGGDVAIYESVLDDKRFPLFADDFEAQASSADRLRELRDRGLTVLPGHDPDVVRPGPLAVGPPA